MIGRASAGAAATEPGEAALSIANGTFAWDAAQAAILHNINLRVTAGQLVIIIGEVGCGKSSLLSALLHEMPATAGEVQVRGRVAYTAQDPWIQNTTVEGNILMGLPRDEAKLQQVIQACALANDLAMLPAGAHTEIGEKGVNLSGAPPIALPHVAHH